MSSNTGSTALNGTNINQLVGADTFYQAGYTGSRVVAVVIDGGHAWNGHETLQHVNTFLDARNVYNARGISYGQLGQYEQHSTWVSAALAGRGTEAYQQGIAFNATLWSGAIATEFVNGTNQWGWTRGYAFTTPFERALLTGVGGRKADVINASIGLLGSNYSSNSVFSKAIDGMIQSSKVTSVVSAMNEGFGSNTVGLTPSAYNSIKVGALGGDTTGYTSIASFSSRGAQDFLMPDGSRVSAVRAAVDIVTPGEHLTLAKYGGTTANNSNGTDITGGANNWYVFNTQGTSFAAPIVAGGATLLNDVAYDRFSNNEHARDGQVIKAVLLNSASKVSGWDNGQVMMADGSIRTTQGLDYSYGAGAMNLTTAFTQFTEGTSDVAGDGGGAISAIGWDYGVIQEGSFVDYAFSNSLAAGSSFSATLNWFVGRSYLGTETGGAINATDDYFTDLALQVFLLDGGIETLVAESNATYNNTEHLHFTLNQSGNYFLRVNWNGELYDYTNNDSQTFGLAWAAVTAVPEPESVAMFLAGLGLVGGVVRRRQKSA